MHLKTINGGKSDPYRFPIKNPGKLHQNDMRAELFELAVRRGEGHIAASGAFAAQTGSHTGRAAADKFIVRDDTTENIIWWDNAKSISRTHFNLLLKDFLVHADGKELFVQDLYAGADQFLHLPARIYCELAWHALFIRNMLLKPPKDELSDFTPEFTIVDMPSFKADPARHGVSSETVIACDFSNKIVLIGGTSYAGEIKKSAFSYLNYLLPEQGVMPMHCSVNEGKNGDTAIFFGLSGTGKTTLSADPDRTLIGDDEHGWSNDGVFNFEDGCYAKMIRLSAKTEPEIYAAVNRFGAVLENVVLDEITHEPKFDDSSLTENTRGAYPLDFIPNASKTGRSGHPRNIVMLTADAFGILPPIAKLTPCQAMYHFLSGYTAKVAGTEEGVTEPQATFSTCFGAPFMPRHPSQYGNLLREKIASYGVDCWIVNTGWSGGKYGVGKRMPIAATRRLLTAALSGQLNSAKMRTDPYFGFQVPVSVEGIDPKILNPRETWDDKTAYDAQARALVDMFNTNFERFEKQVDPDVRAAAPIHSVAAE